MRNGKGLTCRYKDRKKAINELKVTLDNMI